MEDTETFMVRTVPIVRMDCPTCIPLLESEVKKLKGIKEAQGNYMAKTLKVTYDPNQVQLSQIEAAIERVGYQAAYKKYPTVASKLRGLFLKKEQNAIQTIMDSDFRGKVLHASKPIAVLFSSPTCPTCQTVKPSYIEAAQDLREKAEFYEMDIASTQTWRQYDVLTIPTILIFREGEVKARLATLPRKDEIVSALSA